MEFHPEDISRHKIRQIYSEECEATFKAEIGIEQITIAYSRPKTIGNIIAKAKLFETHGREVSKFITGELIWIQTPPSFSFSRYVAYATHLEKEKELNLTTSTSTNLF